MIQSVVIHKYIPYKEALKFLEKHHHKPLKVDITKNYYRFRLINPDNTKKFYMQPIGDYGYYVIEY
jgi:hypothetical protein